MTWIRWDVPTPRHRVIGLLADALKVQRATAHGLYCGACCGFGEFQPDGRAAAVTDSTLEGWAGWEGKRGRFAQVFREKCVEHREGEADLPGVVKGWWRQEALLRKQDRDRSRPGQGTRRASERPPGAERVPLVGNDDDNGNGKESSSSSAGAINGHIGYTARCTAACNRGLRENRSVPGFNELVTGNQLEDTQPWYAAGIPADVAEAAIYQRARSYRPKGRQLQPTTLSYFRNSVEEAHAKAIGQLAEGQVNTAPQPEPDSLEAWRQRREAQRAHQNP